MKIYRFLQAKHIVSIYFPPKGALAHENPEGLGYGENWPKMVVDILRPFNFPCDRAARPIFWPRDKAYLILKEGF